MKRKIRDTLPVLLGGMKRTATADDLLEAVIGWNQDDVEHNIEILPIRFVEHEKTEMSEYLGMSIYSEVVKLMRERDVQTWQTAMVITLAQKKVLYYHNLQYENKNHKLPSTGKAQ